MGSDDTADAGTTGIAAVMVTGDVTDRAAGAASCAHEGPTLELATPTNHADDAEPTGRTSRSLGVRLLLSPASASTSARPPTDDDDGASRLGERADTGGGGGGGGAPAVVERDDGDCSGAITALVLAAAEESCDDAEPSWYCAVTVAAADDRAGADDGDSSTGPGLPRAAPPRLCHTLGSVTTTTGAATGTGDVDGGSGDREPVALPLCLGVNAGETTAACDDDDDDDDDDDATGDRTPEAESAPPPALPLLLPVPVLLAPLPTPLPPPCTTALPPAAAPPFRFRASPANAGADATVDTLPVEVMLDTDDRREPLKPSGRPDDALARDAAVSAAVTAVAALPWPSLGVEAVEWGVDDDGGFGGRPLLLALVAPAAAVGVTPGPTCPIHAPRHSSPSIQTTALPSP